jgi:hypothetical protein
LAPIRIILAAISVAALAFLYATSLLQSAAGYYHDDGIYIETAKSLAEGRGYRLLHLPEEPVQTKYPILLPALLAAVWTVAPSFPANVVLLKLVPFAAAVAWLLVTRALLARFAPQVAGPLVLLVAASPVSIFFSTTVLAESLLALFVSAALWWLDGSDVQSAVLAGICAALAFHSKTIGVVIVLAGVGSYLWRRSYKQCLVFAAVSLVLCLPWTAWQIIHARAASVDTYNSLNNYYKDWSIVGRPVAEQLAVVGKNLILIATSPMHFTGGAPHGLAMVLCAVFTIFGLIGTVMDIRQHGLRALHLYCGLYLAILFVWPWPPLRFVWSILPFLIYFTYLGLAGAGKHAPTVAMLMTFVCFGFGLFAQFHATQVAAAPTLPSGAEQIRWPDFLTAMEAIRDRTAPNDRVLSMVDPAIYLYTGRQAVRGFNADPVKLFYTDQRREALGEARTFEGVISTHKVDWILDMPPGHFAEGPRLSDLLREYARKRGRRGTPVALGFRLLALKTPARQSDE